MYNSFHSNKIIYIATRLIIKFIFIDISFPQIRIGQKYINSNNFIIIFLSLLQQIFICLNQDNNIIKFLMRIVPIWNSINILIYLISKSCQSELRSPNAPLLQLQSPFRCYRCDEEGSWGGYSYRYVSPAHKILINFISMK